jgi:hypothetical protein
MAEEKARILKVLEALSQCKEPTSPADIGGTIGTTAFFAGHDLFELEQTGSAEKPDKEKSLYLITDRGRETLKNPPDKWVSKPRGETPPRGTPPSGAPPGAPPGVPPEGTTGAVPSQCDILRSIGGRLELSVAVAEALTIVWEVTDCLCSERQYPLLPEPVKILRRDGKATITADIEESAPKDGIKSSLFPFPFPCHPQ